MKFFRFVTKATLLCSLLCGVTFSSNAEIHKWVDEAGNVHFSDSPPKNSKSEEITLQINSYTSAEITTINGVIVPSNKVVLYSTTRCGYCKKARRYFRQERIAFHEYDVDKSRKGKRDFKSLKGSSVPIILFGENRINGFSEVKFSRAYAQYKKQKQEEKEKKAADKKNNEGASNI